ncbi:unnamed protein product [Adineta steineri]|uniref:BTB domain-containing protein n=1 Tax=Adineta steineri TaxID=433720 RepID=A0A815A0P4_9BILA|nr:unnamed protein product [Adineta steineri]CAF1293356.1 unnamed protein product [Adineta steineri]CAF3516196.1 unnamed protein product [Adineta steineri]CAF3645017.1 unnamed protein product [Adineta steineri]
MQSVRQSEPIQPVHQPHNDIEPSSTHRRTTFERLFEKSMPQKQSIWNSTQKDTYVSDIINVQSLLNVRAIESQQHKRETNNLLEERIIINLCGDRYETHRTTLELYPNTLLGNRKRRKYYYDKTRKEYFFDRNRACFEAILYYYQSHGRLRRPAYVPIDVFLEEVTFFQLGEEALIQLRKDENLKEVKKVQLPKSRFRRHIWATMEYPDYSITAKIVNIFSLLIILISTISLAIESLPQYDEMETKVCENERHIFDAINRTNTNETDNAYFFCHGYFTQPFFIIQSICVGLFTIELVLRIISTPSLLIYVKNPMNWIDILAVIPYYIFVVFHLVGYEADLYTTAYLCFRLLRSLRFVRIFKFYRVFKNVKSLRVLTSTIKQSIPDFLIMIVILTLVSFLFGSAAYFAENDTNGAAFDSIFKATYWGIITITSVGYGDIYPITPIGRVISCLCALFGAATIGMLVSVLVDRYQRVFARRLYVNDDDDVDLHEYSDDESSGIDSRAGSGRLPRRNNSKLIEDPDARAKENAAFETDDNTMEITPPINTQDIIENPLHQSTTRTHFIIGYVDKEEYDRSLNLLEAIKSIITLKQTNGTNIQLNVISNDQQQSSSPHNVRFQLSTSSTENSDDEDNNELTQIVSGPGNKGNVLRSFQTPLSSNYSKYLDTAEKLL